MYYKKYTLFQSKGNSKLIFNYYLNKKMVRMTKTFTNLGLEGYEILVEADANKSLPGIEII